MNVHVRGIIQDSDSTLRMQVHIGSSRRQSLGSSAVKNSLSYALLHQPAVHLSCAAGKNPSFSSTRTPQKGASFGTATLLNFQGVQS